jgi:hypothetical protein
VTLLGYRNSVTSFTKAIEPGADGIETALGVAGILTDDATLLPRTKTV